MIATVVGLYIGIPGTHISEPVDKLEVLLDGIQQDRHRGEYSLAGAQQSHIVPKGTLIRNLRQISIVSVLELTRIAQNLGIVDVLATDLSANILIDTGDFFGFTRYIGDDTCLVFSNGRADTSAVIRITGENRPCVVAGGNLQQRYPTEKSLASKFVRAAMGMRGKVAVVYQPGIIRVGDTITLVPHQPKLP